ncbi:MAG: GUN4 domain-containing protein [Oscillatoriaceae bacterium SKW80]|nr:GUN4 domain-containing protein [Oscillatoriaceae bacterium SKYG93]MCX8121401.1 GUN4 domain-containing protein [Oscillatoriaceae bacterium SKW80]MDW8451922.1 GUN4 domain-containing protein [Oscillatoriaceae cyanobacterium SKYGB_i_bin93]HIK29465.1 GUN4 domain-containing protein [Oscillatoriaceae cyanobacterium M7585_C2015_266]
MLKQDELISAVGMDYSLLKELLAAGKWKEADLETTAVILKAAGREREGWITQESLANFPCQDLRTIDNLWVKYSQGRFGFSIQKSIYFEVKKDFERFAERVGWRVLNNWLKYSELNFSLNAPVGHLPSGGVGYKRWTRLIEVGYAALASRVDECL